MPAPEKPFPFRIDFPPELPISSRAEEIVAAIQAHQVIILAGETGSGKTTQIPKMCLAAGRGVRGRIACTQPRRVAALSISRRVADELNVNWGREVGCKIRFNDQTTSATVIKFLTDGMLLAEVQGDPMLREYDTVIIDEAHERSLNIDFLLGHLRTLRYKRPDLKVIVTSATIDTAAFSAAFDDAPVIQVEGRTFPVEVIYAPLDSLGSDTAEGDENTAKAEALHYIDGAVEAIERIVHESPSGDLLVFMPSERDIRETTDLLEGRRLKNCEMIPLFGRLSNAEQQRVFSSSQRRKIVVATNIAETSLTIPGIRFVVDTGLSRVSRYSPQSRTRRLPIEPISQSSADQRKGRSGRVAEGVCIRLYSEKDFLERPRFTQPEIQRANLADVILRMKAFGLGDIERFPFINMPATKSIRAGYGLLDELGALAERRSEAGDRRTDNGGRMTEDRGQKTEDRGLRTEVGESSGAESEQTASSARKELPASSATDSPSSVLGPLSSASRSPTSDLRPPSSVTRSPTSETDLSALGRELARLPVDPTIGRMILQARAEKALREVLVIASGLSIQDPRERPMDKQQQADAAHRRFVHPDSDFLTLLEIWEAYHGEFETMSQARLRRFCRDHFLSYTRMREWRDIHSQLHDSLRERDGFRESSVFDGSTSATANNTNLSTENAPRRGMAPTRTDPLAFGTPAYRAIHRSILSGLLGNIAHLDEQNGAYKATHDRRVTLFPGSALFRRDDPKKKEAASTDAKKNQNRRTPKWIMAGEMMETTRLYARTCARLDPTWALDLGAHLVRVAHSEPFWDETQGRVLVKQRTRLYGLELENRSVSYGRVDPVHATEIFIREALINDTITYPLDFLANNRKVRAEIEDLLTRARDSGYLNLDEAAYRFYAERLKPTPARSNDSRMKQNVSDSSELGVSSVAELVDLVREKRGAEPDFLMMEPDDLRDPETIAHDAAAFPAELPLDNRALPLQYAYKPGQAEDGVTVDVSVREAAELTPIAIDWAVPGHLEAKVEHYLKSLPKELRRAFVPLAETAKSVAIQVAQRDRLTGRRESVTQSLAAQLRERFRIAIDELIWSDRPLPDHLRVRIRVVDDEGKEISAGRSLDEIQAALAAHAREASVKVAKADPEGWQRVRREWEKPPQTTWTFGDIPDRVLVNERAGVPLWAFPALTAEGEGVALRLFKTPEEAATTMARGLAALLELQLRYDLGWLERDLRSLRDVGALAATLVPMGDLQSHALESIRRWVTDSNRVAANTAKGAEPMPRYLAAAFATALERGKEDLRGLIPRLKDGLREILELRQSLLVHPHPYPNLDDDLRAILPPDFLRRTPYERLSQLPRYLKGLKLRADRWRQNPAKDAERAKQLAPYVAAIRKLDPVLQANVRWLVEEFRVSLFAQELGTAEPVSTVKLDRAFADVGLVRTTEAKKEKLESDKSGRPVAILPLTEKKTAAVKSLGALDRLFPR